MEGVDAERVSGDVTRTYEAGRTTEVSSNDSHTVGQDGIRTINRHEYVSVGGRHQATVHGPHETLVTNDACRAEVRGAGVYAVKTATGNIDLEPTSGSFRVRTANADKVELGTDPTSHGTKFEELEAALNALKEDYNQFKILTKAHVHVVVGAATDPSVLLSTLAAFVSNWSPAKSAVVKLL